MFLQFLKESYDDPNLNVEIFNAWHIPDRLKQKLTKHKIKIITQSSLRGKVFAPAGVKIVTTY